MFGLLKEPMPVLKNGLKMLGLFWHGLFKETQNLVEFLYAGEISCIKDKRHKSEGKTDFFCTRFKDSLIVFLHKSQLSLRLKQHEN